MINSAHGNKCNRGHRILFNDTIVAQKPFYMLRYQLSSQAPDPHLAVQVSALILSGRLAVSGVILLTGLFTNAGYFYASFTALTVILLEFGAPLALRVQKEER